MIIRKPAAKRVVYDILHVVVLVLSIFLVIAISLDTFHNVAFYREQRFMRVQFLICMVFLGDFVVEFFMSDRKRHYLTTHFVFLIVSIPYNAIVSHLNIVLPSELQYLMRFIPLVRGGYALAIVVGWFTSNRAAGMVITYVLTLFASVYFASMVFYVVEHNVNAQVVDYPDALFWAAMEMVTTGSDIHAITPIGRCLGFVMSCLGMMMLPMFTVYISSVISRHSSILKDNVPAPLAKDDVRDTHGSDAAVGSDSRD